MANYAKPQEPLYSKKSDSFFYPLTTIDQVIVDEETRLSGLNFLTIDKNGSVEGEIAPVNADTLGGYDAEHYVTVENVVNNFTTTEEGYIADARALKTLNDDAQWKLLGTSSGQDAVLLPSTWTELKCVLWSDNDEWCRYTYSLLNGFPTGNYRYSFYVSSSDYGFAAIRLTDTTIQAWRNNINGIDKISVAKLTIYYR